MTEYRADVAIDEYHASDLVSHSKLRTFVDVGPGGYRARVLLGENKHKATPEQVFGQMVEDAIQQPAAFLASVRELPDIEGKATDDMLAEAMSLGVLQDDGKPYTKRHAANTVALAISQAKGERVISRADMERIERIVRAFERNDECARAIEGMATQVSIVDRWEMDMVPGIQCRPDWYHLGTGASVDLKTCSDFNAFDRAIVSRGYHTQAALINLATSMRAPRTLIAAESVWPYRVQVIKLSPSWDNAGEQWCCDVIGEMRECYARDEWPACVKRRTAEVPAYLARSMDDGW